MQIEGEFVVIDFETTGLNPAKGDRITEVAALRIRDMRITDRFVSLVNCGVAIPPFVQTLTGITDAMRRDAPSVSAVLPQLVDFIGDLPLCAHNASFDRRFLENECQIAGLKHSSRSASYICTLRLSQRYFPTIPNYQLATVASFLKLSREGKAHRAESDALLARDVLFQIAKAAGRAFERDWMPVRDLARLSVEGKSWQPKGASLANSPHEVQNKETIRSSGEVWSARKAPGIGAAKSGAMPKKTPTRKTAPPPIVPSSPSPRGPMRDGGRSVRPEAIAPNAISSGFESTARCLCRSCNSAFIAIDDTRQFRVRCPICGSNDTHILTLHRPSEHESGSNTPSPTKGVSPRKAGAVSKRHSSATPIGKVSAHTAPKGIGSGIPTQTLSLPWEMSKRTRVLRHRASGSCYSPLDYVEIRGAVPGYEIRNLSAQHAFARRIDVDVVDDDEGDDSPVTSRKTSSAAPSPHTKFRWSYSRRTGVLIDNGTGTSYRPDQYEETDFPVRSFVVWSGSRRTIVWRTDVLDID